MNQVINTKPADCKDCYRCLRACPVKAISFIDHQARVEPDLCIMCGICVVECPQQAKSIQDNTGLVRDYLESGEKTVLSIAPSFPASFPGEAGSNLQRFKQLGFAAVEETAIGAAYTIEGYRQQLQQNVGRTMLSSCCPVVVNLIEKYYSDLLEHLLPVPSPMVAHARYIKAVYGENTQVVFAGPCIAKLKEAEENGLTALTFGQLKQLSKQVDLSLQPAGLDLDQSLLSTRIFAIDRGVLRSMSIPENKQDDYWSVAGIDDCREVLDALRDKEIQPAFIELMACRGGCVGGPAIDSPYPLYKRKNQIRDWNRQPRVALKITEPVVTIPMDRSYHSDHISEANFTEEQIKEVLTRMGKHTPRDERNCEGCGYNSCRDKAVAVLKGLAVTEMCIPYMRSKAESLANTIVESNPSAILVLDQQMRVQSFNTAAINLLPEVPWSPGLNISEYLDTSLYQQVLETQVTFIEQKSYFHQGALITRQQITPLQEKGMIMVVITDITQFEQRRIHYDSMKEDISAKAREVIRRQMMAAQSIAGLLGETTAETKATLLELLAHLESDKF